MEEARRSDCELIVAPNKDDCDFNSCDGAVFLGQNEYESYTRLERAKRPFVIVEDHPDPDVASVGADIHLPVYRTLRKILDSGVTRIAYIGMTTSRMLFTDVEKFRAYLEAVDDVRHRVDFSFVRHSWPLPEYFYEQFRDMLRRPASAGPLHHLRLRGAGVYRAAEEAGYKIPEHIQVLSCDNLKINVNPKPASFEVPSGR
jgi:DNA-binding LacI/PurR family transcriptional regulator